MFLGQRIQCNKDLYIVSERNNIRYENHHQSINILIISQRIKDKICIKHTSSIIIN